MQKTEKIYLAQNRMACCLDSTAVSPVGNMITNIVEYDISYIEEYDYQQENIERLRIKNSINPCNPVKL